MVFNFTIGIQLLLIYRYRRYLIGFNRYSIYRGYMSRSVDISEFLIHGPRHKYIDFSIFLKILININEYFHKNMDKM